MEKHWKDAPWKSTIISIIGGQVQLTDGKTESQISSSSAFTGKPKKQLMAGNGSDYIIAALACFAFPGLRLFPPEAAGAQKALNSLPSILNWSTVHAHQWESFTMYFFYKWVGGEKDFCFHCWVFWIKEELQWCAVSLENMPSRKGQSQPQGGGKDLSYHSHLWSPQDHSSRKGHTGCYHMKISWAGGQLEK